MSLFWHEEHAQNGSDGYINSTILDPMVVQCVKHSLVLLRTVLLCMDAGDKCEARVMFGMYADDGVQKTAAAACLLHGWIPDPRTLESLISLHLDVVKSSCHLPAQDRLALFVVHSSVHCLNARLAC